PGRTDRGAERAVGAPAVRPVPAGARRGGAVGPAAPAAARRPDAPSLPDAGDRPVTVRSQKVIARPSWGRCVVPHTGGRCLSPRSAADPSPTVTGPPRSRSSRTGRTAARPPTPPPTYRCRPPWQRS